jgi:hypothetical protein
MHHFLFEEEMNYKEIQIIQSSASGDNNDLLIDGIRYNYDYTISCRGTLLWRIQDGQYYRLNCQLPLNKENPKETLDQFFKLLILQ